jgi:hypothetical protein
MGPSIVLALLLYGTHATEPIHGVQLWEETAIVQKAPGYHPFLRFASWDITRFNLSTTYMFATPKLVQQGQYQVSGSQYFFRAVMANELENADMAKLIAGMDPQSGRETRQTYALSMFNFEASYNESSKALYVTYPVNGHPQTFELYATNQGDDQLQASVSEAERAMVGLWQAPDPFPGRLDARTRQKIDEQGLQHFIKEASDSDGAQFSVVDLRVDRSFRIHKTVGTWQRSGNTLTLTAEGKQTNFTISRDGSKLLLSGKPVFVRN